MKGLTFLMVLQKLGKTCTSTVRYLQAAADSAKCNNFNSAYPQFPAISKVEWCHTVGVWRFPILRTNNIISALSHPLFNYFWIPLKALACTAVGTFPRLGTSDLHPIKKSLWVGFPCHTVAGFPVAFSIVWWVHSALLPAWQVGWTGKEPHQGNTEAGI